MKPETLRHIRRLLEADVAHKKHALFDYDFSIGSHLELMRDYLEYLPAGDPKVVAHKKAAESQMPARDYAKKKYDEALAALEDFEAQGFKEC